MLESLTLAAAGNFIRKNWVYFGIAGALALALVLAYCWGGAGEREKQARQTIKTQRQVGKANDEAAEHRIDDAVKLEQQKQEIKDALQNATSSDDARRRAGCAILHQQGRDTSAIPSCR